MALSILLHPPTALWRREALAASRGTFWVRMDGASSLRIYKVNCQLRDFQRIGHPLAWIVGSEDVLNRLALLFAWEATEHRCVRRAWAQGIHANPAVHEFGAEDSSEMDDRSLAGRDDRGCRPPFARANGRIDDYRRALSEQR